jgi:hypothetical protein
VIEAAMTFVTFWKASSVLLTGAFGILGLMRDYRSKETGEVTKWGKIALCGILISTIFGVIAQLQESSQDEKAKRATAAQTLALAQKTDNAVHDIQRLLTPISSPTVTVVWDIKCDSKLFRTFCTGQKSNTLLASSAMYTAGFREIPDDFSVVLRVAIFSDPKAADAFVELDDLNGPTTGDLDFRLIGAKQNYTKAAGATPLRVFSHNGDKFGLLLSEGNPISLQSSGTITSTRDLLGSTFVVSEWSNSTSSLDLDGLAIHTANGQKISLVASDKYCTIRTESKFTYEVCQIPNDLEGQKMFGTRLSN